jgi:hypothetical protein
MATRDGVAVARMWATYFRGAADETIRRPLWEFPPSACAALKHERRRRFKWDIDSEGER